MKYENKKMSLPELRLIKTSHGTYDLSRLSRPAKLRRFQSVIDPITHEAVQNIVMPIAEKGPNNTLTTRIYDLPELVKWLDQNPTMPHNRQYAGNALVDYAAVRWIRDRPGDCRPPQEYNWVRTAHALQDARARYPPREDFQENEEHEEEEEESEDEEEEPNPDDITYDDKYRQFRMQMIEFLHNPQNAPQWYTRYFQFHPFCQKDIELGIQNPGLPVALPQPEQDNLQAFRQEMAIRLEDYYPYNNVRALARAYWIVHPINFDSDNDPTIQAYFLNMPRNVNAFWYPAFFLRQYNFDRDRYRRLQILR